MKKNVKIILSLILASVMLFTFGCSMEWGVPSVPDYEDKTEYTEHLLAENGASDYKIVIPAKATEYETFAAEELQLRFNEATSVELPIVRDTGMAFSENDKVISVGATTVRDGSGVEFDYSVLKESGTRLVNKGSAIILSGAKDEGSLYAVYDFLKALFNYEYYDVDAYRLDKKDVVKLPTLDVTNIPDNDYRMYGDFLQEPNVGGDRKHAFRLRLKVYGQGYAVDGHASTFLVNPSQLADIHPTWFSSDRLQLCYTNEEMTAYFIEQVKAKLTEVPDATVISCAQADYNTWCNCSNCTETMKKYGNGGDGFGTVTQNLFINKVATAVNEWLATAYPGRHVKYMLLAYHQTVEAPAHKNADGVWVPNGSEEGDMSMVLHDDVVVQYASIYADRNLSFKENPVERDRLNAWACLTKGLYIYEYPQDAKNVCIPYDGLHVFAENIRFSKELGYSSYFLQGVFNTQASGFTPLKAYVASKLMWDCSLDTNDLALDYIKNAYGEAAPVMEEYFVALRTRMAYLRDAYGYGAFCLSDNCTQRFWPITVLRSYQEMFDRAYAAIEHIKYVDADRHEILFRKIKIEEMFVKYAFNSLYITRLSNAEKAAEIDEFEYYAKKYGFKNWSETQPMAEKIAIWRNS